MKWLLSVIAAILLFLFSSPGFGSESLSGQYEIGVNDSISIKVLGHPDLDVFATVAADGTISFPHLGSVYVKDKTLNEVKEIITKKLSDGYVKFPVVAVALIQALSKRIFVHGEVQKIGTVAFEKDMTVVMALSMAGGIRDGGLYGRLKVRRKQKEGGYKTIIDAGLHNGMIEDKKIEDKSLQTDDILIVERNDTYLIQGEVARRGRFVLEKNMTVVRALLEAGGVTAEGLHGKILVRRKRGETDQYKKIVEANLHDGVIESSEVENTILQTDDILVIERNKTYLIQGEVAKRGRFVLEKNMTVVRALLEAGGVTTEGLHGKIMVRRKLGETDQYKKIVEANLIDGVIESSEVENTILQADDILVIERNKTFLIQGEVAKRGRFVLEKNMTVVRAMLEAGGVATEGLHGKIMVRRKLEESGQYKKVVEADLHDGVIESSEVEDTILQADDILVVERSKTFILYGEFTKIGEYVLKDDMTVFKALTISGGLTKWGSEKKIKILRSTDKNMGFEIIKININDILKGDAAADIMLQPGDIIVATRGIL